ncbi:MAG: hypothetical protein L3J00_06475, partial [Thiomicrorhabdus sp.]|nr:hypothetical protein [Thiomicrorhabdus sp.]
SLNLVGNFAGFFFATWQNLPIYIYRPVSKTFSLYFSKYGTFSAVPSMEKKACQNAYTLIPR